MGVQLKIKCGLVPKASFPPNTAIMSTPPPRWLRHYLPTPVLRAAEVLADHVDFWEEEAFRVNGRWRRRELTEFIRAGLLADRAQSVRLRRLLAEYVEMSVMHWPTEVEEERKRALNAAVMEARRWVHVMEKN